MSNDPFFLAAQALRKRERSRRELADYLSKRGVLSGDVERVVDELVSIGELDDARFAARYAEDKRELKGWGTDRIEAALRQRGVGETEIAAAIASDREDELARAVSLIAGRSDPLDTDAARARALSFLTRRGYPYEIAHEAVRSTERRAA